MLVELSKMEQRYQAVLAVQADGLTVTEVADKFGVSRQTVHEWLRRYEAGGLAALGDRSHRPVSCPHQMPAAVEARVCELRREHPFWGPVRIAHQLGREGVDPVPSHMGIWRALGRHGLIEPKKARKRLVTFKRWERGRPMELWQLDVVGGVLLDDGTECKVLTGVDDHSRFCVAAGIMTRAVSRAVCGVFAQSLRTYGVPDEVLTDNGTTQMTAANAASVTSLSDHRFMAPPLHRRVQHNASATPRERPKVTILLGTDQRPCRVDSGSVFIDPVLPENIRRVDVPGIPLAGSRVQISITDGDVNSPVPNGIRMAPHPRQVG